MCPTPCQSPRQGRRPRPGSRSRSQSSSFFAYVTCSGRLALGEGRGSGLVSVWALVEALGSPASPWPGGMRCAGCKCWTVGARGAHSWKLNFICLPKPSTRRLCSLSRVSPLLRCAAALLSHCYAAQLAGQVGQHALHCGARPLRSHGTLATALWRSFLRREWHCGRRAIQVRTCDLSVHLRATGLRGPHVPRASATVEGIS